MKITYSLRANFVKADSDEATKAPRALNGWTYEDDQLAKYFDPDLADLEITGGIIRTSVLLDGSVWLHVDYSAPARLDEATLDTLTHFTTSQMTHVMGETGFEFTDQGHDFLILPDTRESIDAEQIDDGKATRKRSRIAIAARDGDLDGLRKALESASGIAVDELHQQCTGLVLAITSCKVEAALILIAHGADPNRPDPEGCTPLILCAIANKLSDDESVRIAEALLKAGADPTRDRDEWTPLKFAQNRGKAKLAALLGGKVSAESPKETKPAEEERDFRGIRAKSLEDAFAVAALNGKTREMNLFIADGVDVNSVASWRKAGTALTQAIRDGKPKVVDLLIDAKADLNAIDDMGLTPLMIACHEGKVTGSRIALRLIEAGADVHRARGRDTALDFAVQYSKPEVVQKLIDKGMDVNGLREEQITPLMLAARADNVEALKVLVANGADITRPCGLKWAIGWTAEKLAENEKRKKALAYLKQVREAKASD